MQTATKTLPATLRNKISYWGSKPVDRAAVEAAMFAWQAARKAEGSAPRQVAAAKWAVWAEMFVQLDDRDKLACVAVLEVLRKGESR